MRPAGYNGRIMRAGLWPICIVFCARAAGPADLLDRFLPSPVQTGYGVASEVEFSTGFVELEPGSLAFHLPRAMRNLQFSEPVWVIGYKTGIVDGGSGPPRDNYLCHTFLADERVMQREDQELKGIYSDAFTPEVRLPDGYGIPLAAGERLHWMPMFNNRGEEPARVAMKVVLTRDSGEGLEIALETGVRDSAQRRGAAPVFRSAGAPREASHFQSPFTGSIHFLGTHLHPYGVSVELYNVTRGEQVWKGARENTVSGPMPVYAEARGYAVRQGETYRITAVYKNPTCAKIDAMAGLFMLYSRRIAVGRTLHHFYLTARAGPL